MGLIFLQGLLWRLELLAEAFLVQVAAVLAGELVPGHWCSPAAAPGTTAGSTNAVFSVGSRPDPLL